MLKIKIIHFIDEKTTFIFLRQYLFNIIKITFFFQNNIKNVKTIFKSFFSIKNVLKTPIIKDDFILNYE